MAMKMCPQHPGEQAKAEMGADWTSHHTVALWPQPSYSRWSFWKASSRPQEVHSVSTAC